MNSTSVCICDSDYVSIQQSKHITVEKSYDVFINHSQEVSLDKSNDISVNHTEGMALHISNHVTINHSKDSKNHSASDDQHLNQNLSKEPSQWQVQCAIDDTVLPFDVSDSRSLSIWISYNEHLLVPSYIFATVFYLPNYSSCLTFTCTPLVHQDHQYDS